MTDNKTIYRDMIDAVNRADADGLSQLIAPDILDHNAPPGQAPGLAGILQWVVSMHAALSGAHATVEDVVAEAGKVAARVTWTGVHRGEFLGVPATGKRLSFAAIHIVRIADGKVVEWWGVPDLLAAMQQMSSTA